MKNVGILAVAVFACGQIHSDLGDPVKVKSSLGIKIYSQPECPEWSRAGHIMQRIEFMARSVGAHAGADPKMFSGWTVSWQVTTSCGAAACTWIDTREIEQTCDAPCPEATVIGHELFHVAQGWQDFAHEDPRWKTLYPVLLQVAEFWACPIARP